MILIIAPHVILYIRARFQTGHNRLHAILHPVVANA
jgi:hypothetical protein